MIKDKTRDEILSELYATEFIPNYIKKLANGSDQPFLEDLEQEVWLIVSQLSEERLRELYYQHPKKHPNGDINNVRRFVAGIIYRQEKSVTSAYYKQYKKPLEKLDKNNELSLAEKEACGLFSKQFEFEAHDGELDWSDNIRYE